MADKTGAEDKIAVKIENIPRCRASDIPMALRHKIIQDVNTLPIPQGAGWRLKTILPEGDLNRHIRRGTKHPFERVWFHFDISLAAEESSLIPPYWWPVDNEDGTREQGLILRILSAIQNLASVHEANLSMVEPGRENTIGGEYRMIDTVTLAISFYYETPEQIAKEEEAHRVAMVAGTLAFQKALGDWFTNPDGLIAKMQKAYNKKIKALENIIKRLEYKRASDE